MSAQVAQGIEGLPQASSSGVQWFPYVGFHAPVVVARDRRTLEFRSFYPLPTERKQGARFSHDTYFFFPGSFGVNPESWSASVFYRNSRVYSRLHAPSLTLANLRALSHPLNPIGLLHERLDTFLHDHSISGHAMTALAQMSGAELTDAILQEARSLRHSLRLLGDGREQLRPEVLLRQLEGFCRDGYGALQALRRVAARAQVYQGVTHPELLPSLAFAQEYGCAIFDEQLSEVAVAIAKRPELRDQSAAAVKMRLCIAETLEQLNVWRRAAGFALPHSRDSEYYAYRVNLLKKEVQRSLYVNSQSNAKDPFLTNGAAMVAAGLAATWATLAQVPMIMGRWTTTEGMMLFAAAVGAYILKDRIKDWVKSRLTRRWLPWDHDVLMEGNALADAGLGSFIGRARERMRWLDEQQLPDEVTRMRRAYRTVRGATIELEQALHYHRALSFTEDKDHPLPVGYGVQEIHRIALDDIVRRLDDPTDNICYYDDASTHFKRDTIPRVYHLNVIQIATDHCSGRRFKTRTRIVLNQKQILRVEPVLVERE